MANYIGSHLQKMNRCELEFPSAIFRNSVAPDGHGKKQARSRDWYHT
jgi:hypothetical protein